MRLSIALLLFLSLVFSKEIGYRIKNLNQQTGSFISITRC